MGTASICNFSQAQASFPRRDFERAQHPYMPRFPWERGTQDRLS